MLEAMDHSIDKALYTRGFTSGNVRRVMRLQILLSGAAVLFAVLMGWFYFWAVAFAISAALVTFNFYGLARFVQQMGYPHYTRALLISMLIRVYGRLFLTGVVLVLLIVVFHASVVAVLAGVTTILATIFVWGGAQLVEQKVKEA